MDRSIMISDIYEFPRIISMTKGVSIFKEFFLNFREKIDLLVLELYHKSGKNLDVFSTSRYLALRILEKHHILRAEIESTIRTFEIDQESYVDKTERTKQNLEYMKNLDIITNSGENKKIKKKNDRKIVDRR